MDVREMMIGVGLMSLMMVGVDSMGLMIGIDLVSVGMMSFQP